MTAARLITQHDRTLKLNGRDVSHLSIRRRANLWVLDGSTGLSSLCIWGHMTGTRTEGHTTHYPNDLADFNRCLLLLEIMPEWRERMHEMKAHGPFWSALADVWEELTHLFLEDHGLNWLKKDPQKRAKESRAGILLAQTLSSVRNRV